MANSEKATVTIEELLVSCLASNDALAKLLIEKGIITEQEFLQRISEERVVYQRMLNTTVMNYGCEFNSFEGVTLAGVD
jgi:hypothetical protein